MNSARPKPAGGGMASWGKSETNSEVGNSTKASSRKEPSPFFRFHTAVLRQNEDQANQ
tara:strand:- start:29 stop:202 length:174 start_codon:yes stop_codon:yes gene_type:complete